MGTSAFGFVDAISTAPTYRLNLEAGRWSVLNKGTTCPPPRMRRQVTSNTLTDGDTITSASYENRELRINVQLEERASPDAAATSVQALYRELNRPRSVFLYQPDVTMPPVFFRTYRAADLNPDLDFGIGLHRFELVIPAEPFAYGTVESIGPFTVNMDPAAGSNGCFFDVSGVKGDVDTPLWLSVLDPDFDMTGLCLATRRRGTPSNGVWFKQAEAATSFGSDTAVSVSNDAAFSGSGNNYARCTFATTATEVSRLTFFYPLQSFTGSPDYKGTYRVFARVRKNTGAATVAVRLSYATVQENAPAVITTTSTSPLVVDLGLLPSPARNVGSSDGYGPEIDVVSQQIDVYAERRAGTGSLDFDCLIFVPADQEHALITTNAEGHVLVFDGPNRGVYVVSEFSGGLVSPFANSQRRTDGTLPLLTPGAQTNRVFVVNGLSTAYSPAIGSSASFSAKYWPRYLHVRPTAS